MNTTIRFLKAAIPALLSCCWCLTAAIAEEQKSPESPELKVGVSPVFPPMVFKQGKEIVGAEVELARALGESIGRKVKLVELPWAEQLEALKSGKTDIIMSSMSITTARRYTVDFTRPYLLIGQMALVRGEDQARYLMGFPLNPPGTVGILKATTGEFLVQRDFPKAKRKAFSSEADAVEALKKKKIDLFISDSTLVCYLAGVNSVDGLAVVPIALSEESLAWGVRKGDEKLLNSANEFIQKVSEDGTLKKVFRRWGAVPP